MRLAQTQQTIRTSHGRSGVTSRALAAITTIRGRIWLAFFSVALITTSLGVYASFGIERAGVLVEKTYNQSLMSISYARAASADFSAMQAQFARRASAKDDVARELADATIETLYKSLTDDILIAGERSQSPRALEATEQARLAAVQWHDAIQRQPRGEVGDAAWADLDTSATKVGDDIGRLINYIAGDGFIYRQNAKSLVRGDSLLNAFGTALAFASSGLIALHLARRTTGLVTVASAFAEKIASGELEGELPRRSADELGALISAMGVMRDKLREVVQREMAERRSAQAHLADALEGSKAGIVMIDAQGVVAMANSQVAEFFDIAADKRLSGVPFADLSGPLAEAIASSNTNGAETRLADGRWIRVSRSLALEGGFVAVCADISELKDQQLQLQETNGDLDVALTNMSQGLCMYDSRDRLRVVNRRFHEIFGVAQDRLHPGMPQLVVAELVASSGGLTSAAVGELLCLSDDDWLGGAPRASSVYPARLIEFLDGRTIAVVKHRLQDGGWVATYEDVTENKRAQDDVVFLARHDVLTKLPNRLLLGERTQNAIDRLNGGEGFAMFCLDLDRFKEINDTFGHPCGDELLRQVGQRLVACVRSVDTVCRMGGDEFAIVQSGVNKREQTTQLATRIVQALATPYRLDGRLISVGVSIGIAIAPEHGCDFEKLLRSADAALYATKKNGQGGWRFFDREIEDHLQYRGAIETELRAALAKGEFELQYQPIFDLRRRAVTVFEALLRWNHPERGQVGPADFIALCEETGLIIPIGDWVLNAACAEARNWSSEIKVAVNVSAAQLTDPLFSETVQNALASSGLSPDRLELEITESVMMSNSSRAVEVLRKISDTGVCICLDDFGTGYSSLSYLHKFPFYKIKIDRSFIRDLMTPNGSDVIVKSIIDLSFSIGVRITAEGVETDEQLDWLLAAGCGEVQGYLISRPVPAAQVYSLLVLPDREFIAA